MRFVIRKRRSTPTIIIVALVDVLIVLLIFLMVTTTFKQQPGLKLALPESSQAQKEGYTTNALPFIINITSNAVIVLNTEPRATFGQPQEPVCRPRSPKIRSSSSPSTRTATRRSTGS